MEYLERRVRGSPRRAREPLIVLRGVSKKYRSLLGRAPAAVDDVSLEVPAGEVLGIAGPNGAGKTTLVALLLGFLRPTRGTLTISGLPPRVYVERHGVSYLPEVMSLPTQWTTQSALTRLAVLAGIPRGQVRRRVERVIDDMQMGDQRKKRLRSLSKGNLQRVGLAQALLTDTRLVIFDEPTHGLDPVWTRRFRDLVQGLRRDDRAIIIASHNLDELERLADRVAIMDAGRIQRVVAMSAAPVTAAMTYLIRVSAGAAAVLAHFPGARQLANGDVEIAQVDAETLNRGLAAAIAAGAVLSALIPRESALEQAFHSVVGEPP